MFTDPFSDCLFKCLDHYQRDVIWDIVRFEYKEDGSIDLGESEVNTFAALSLCRSYDSRLVNMLKIQGLGKFLNVHIATLYPGAYRRFNDTDGESLIVLHPEDPDLCLVVKLRDSGSSVSVTMFYRTERDEDTIEEQDLINDFVNSVTYVIWKEIAN